MKTVKEIAEQLGVTPQAVRNEIKRQNMQSTLQSVGKQRKALCISDEDTNAIISAFNDRRAGNRQSKQSEATKQTNDTLFVTLLHEIDVKNKQIESMTEQIAAMQKQIDDLTAMLKAEQALHHQTQLRIEDKSRRGIWDRIRRAWKGGEDG